MTFNPALTDRRVGPGAGTHFQRQGGTLWQVLAQSCSSLLTGDIYFLVSQACGNCSMGSHRAERSLTHSHRVEVLPRPTKPRFSPDSWGQGLNLQSQGPAQSCRTRAQPSHTQLCPRKFFSNSRIPCLTFLLEQRQQVLSSECLPYKGSLF